MNLFPEAFANEGVAPAPQGDMSFLIIMAVFMLGFYIFVLRPQNKKKKEQQNILNEMKVGDEVLTNGGMIGRIVKISEDKDTYTLEISDNVMVKFKKAYIVCPVPKGSLEENKVPAKK